MILELIHIATAAIICLTLFVALDLFWKLPMRMGVCGADAISREIVAIGGDKHGGWMIGNIICSPDASAGTLFAACGYWTCGILGGIIATVLIFVGAHICADKGWAGISGTISATLIIWMFDTFAGFQPESFIAGMIIAILLLQGTSARHTSSVIGNLWRRI
jgi:energy-converting hydrogenase A subunit B